MTELVPQIKSSALDGAADLDTVLKTVLARKPSSGAEKPSTASKKIEVSEDTRKAISHLNHLLSTTNLPADRRRLTDTELTQLEQFGTTAKLVEKKVGQVVAGVKEAVFNHFDVGLEAHNDPDELVDLLDPKTGHYLVKGEQPIPGTEHKFVRQLSEAAPSVSAASLKALWEEGVISRATYYKLTKKVEVPRELNEEALLDALKKDPSLAEKIAPAIQPGKVTASFWIRPMGDQ